MAKRDTRHSGGDAGTSRDDDEQKRLRHVVLQELENVMKRHDVGGVLFVASREAAAWRFVLPRWGGLVAEQPGMLRLRISGRTPALRQVADWTMHFTCAMRDLCGHAAMALIDLVDNAERQLGPGNLVHRPLHLGKTEDG